MAHTTLDDPAALARVMRGENGNACPTQAAVLRWLVRHGKHHGPAPNYAAVGRELDLTRQSVTRAIARLRARGFLEVVVHREPRAPKQLGDRVTRIFQIRVPAEANQLHLPLGGS